MEGGDVRGSGCSVSSCGHLTAACMSELASQELQQQESHATGHRDGVVREAEQQRRYRALLEVRRNSRSLPASQQCD